MSSASALRISYITLGAAVLATLIWIGAQVLKLPLPPKLQVPIMVLGMTWPLSLYAVALYRRKLSPK